MARRDEGASPWAVTEEQRSQPAFSEKTPPGGGSFVCGLRWLGPPQPAAGMLRPRRLGRSQNPSPQDPTQF